MPHHAHETTKSGPRGAGAEPRARRRVLRRAMAAAGIVVVLAGCAGASTYYDRRTGWVFDATGTDLDCATVARENAPGTYWHGLAGGLISIGPGETRNISREVCFKSRAQCHYWLTQMDGALTRVTTSQCTRR